MVRGRAPNLSLPSTRALEQQRSYRARKANKLQQLEEDNEKLREEREELVRENEKLKEMIRRLQGGGSEGGYFGEGSAGIDKGSGGREGAEARIGLSRESRRSRSPTKRDRKQDIPQSEIPDLTTTSILTKTSSGCCPTTRGVCSTSSSVRKISEESRISTTSPSSSLRTTQIPTSHPNGTFAYPGSGSGSTPSMTPDSNLSMRRTTSGVSDNEREGFSPSSTGEVFNATRIERIEMNDSQYSQHYLSNQSYPTTLLSITHQPFPNPNSAPGLVPLLSSVYQQPSHHLDDFHPNPIIQPLHQLQNQQQLTLPPLPIPKSNHKTPTPPNPNPNENFNPEPSLAIREAQGFKDDRKDDDLTETAGIGGVEDESVKDIGQNPDQTEGQDQDNLCCWGVMDCLDEDGNKRV